MTRITMSSRLPSSLDGAGATQREECMEEPLQSCWQVSYWRACDSNSILIPSRSSLRRPMFWMGAPAMGRWGYIDMFVVVGVFRVLCYVLLKLTINGQRSKPRLLGRSRKPEGSNRMKEARAGNAAEDTKATRKTANNAAVGAAGVMSVERRATAAWGWRARGTDRGAKRRKDGWGRGSSKSLLEWHCTQPRANDGIRGVDGDGDVWRCANSDGCCCDDFGDAV